MYLRIVISAILISVACLQGQAADFYPVSKAEKEIRSALKEKGIEITQEVEVADELLSEYAIAIYRFTSPGSGELKYAVFSEAMGRHDKFEYVMITNSGFQIEKIKILKYRSEHGGEIASKKWLSQFESFSGGTLNYGKDISALSGATVSAISMVTSIPKSIDILKKSSR